MIMCHVKVVSVCNFQIDTPELTGEFQQGHSPIQILKKEKQHKMCALQNTGYSERNYEV